MEGTESLKRVLKIQMIYALVSYNFYEIKCSCVLFTPASKFIEFLLGSEKLRFLRK